jgi:hypothetical protein
MHLFSSDWHHRLVENGVLCALCGRSERHALLQCHKLRQLFVVPNAEKHEFFYGINFELSYAMPQFSDTKWNMEVRQIIGWREGD